MVREDEIGLLEWFDSSKGFGVIKTTSNEEFFFHQTNWIDDVHGC
jgi:cold shock CspA family protein